MKTVLTNKAAISRIVIRLFIHLHICTRCIVTLEFNVSGSLHKSNVFFSIFIDTNSVVMCTAFLGFPTISIPDFVTVPYAPSWTSFSYPFYLYYYCWCCCRREIPPKVKTGSAVTPRKFYTIYRETSAELRQAFVTVSWRTCLFALISSSFVFIWTCMLFFF